MNKRFLTILFFLILAWIMPCSAIIVPGGNNYGMVHWAWLTENLVTVEAVELFSVKTADLIKVFGMKKAESLTVAQFNTLKLLQDTVKSSSVSHWLEKKDYAKLRAELAGVIDDDNIEALIVLTKREMPYAPLPKPPFFISIGEVATIDQLNKVVNLTEIDCILIPIYQIDRKLLDEMVRNVRNSNKQIIFAFDFVSQGVYLLDLIEDLKDVRNSNNEPILHSAIILWGQQNAIDLSVDKFAECYQNADEIVTLIKAIYPDLYVYKLNCLLYDKEKMQAWVDAMQNLRTDGFVIWGRYCEDAFNNSWKVIEGSNILAGFFGLCDDRGYPRIFNDTDVIYMKTRLPEIIDQVKHEGWTGINLQGLDNWIKVLTK